MRITVHRQSKRRLARALRAEDRALCVERRLGDHPRYDGKRGTVSERAVGEAAGSRSGRTVSSPLTTDGAIGRREVTRTLTNSFCNIH